jgi:hypothetical protein
MSTICFDDTTPSLLRQPLNDVPNLPKQHTRLDQLDSLIQTISRCLNDPHRIRVSPRLVANVVRLVEVAVEAPVVEGYVNV